MGKWNKKRPSSNCAGRSGILRDNPCADLLLPLLVIQIHCGRWFIPWCNMALLQVFCPVFNVGDSVGGNGDAVVRRRMTTNKRMTKKVSGSMAPFSFPTWLWTNILAGWCEISLHRLLVAIPVGRWRHCSFHLFNHHVVSRLWVLLQTVLSWTPTKHCLTSN